MTAQIIKTFIAKAPLLNGSSNYIAASLELNHFPHPRFYGFSVARQCFWRLSALEQLTCLRAGCRSNARSADHFRELFQLLITGDRANGRARFLPARLLLHRQVTIRVACDLRKMRD